MRLRNSAQQTCQSSVSQSMGQWVHEILKLSESAQLGNQEKNLKQVLLYKVVNKPDTLMPLVTLIVLVMCVNCHSETFIQNNILTLTSQYPHP